MHRLYTSAQLYNGKLHIYIFKCIKRSHNHALAAYERLFYKRSQCMEKSVADNDASLTIFYANQMHMWNILNDRRRLISVLIYS